MLNLDWQTIRPLDGSQAKGFEELCAQLARTESPANARFVRKGTPDAGVECYCVLPDGSEWGWQAKHFDSLGPSQWSQLDRSVQTALDKHPRLVRYFVCIPMDRADARIGGQTSALERWNQRVEKWEGWAQERNIQVEFVWWGSSELLERLSQPQHIGRLFYWFGKRGFDQSWFEACLNGAIRTAGPRYTPKVHVELDIALQLETFGRTDDAFNRIKSLAIGIRQRLQFLRYPIVANDDSRGRYDLDELLRAGEDVLDAFAALESTPAGELSLAAVAEKVAAAESVASAAHGAVSELEHEYEAQRSRDDRGMRHPDNPFTRIARDIYGLQNELGKARAGLADAAKFGNSRLMILKGAAGTGKTHLLCDFARKRADAEAPVILLMGQRFTEPAEPWGQVLQQVEMHGEPIDHFVGALEAAAQASNSRALVMIDAVNEGRGREIWPNHLSAFLARLEETPWIGVVLSVRTTYEEVVIPEGVRDRAPSVIHHGFEGHEYDAARMFFTNYGLEFQSTPILDTEFRNPLYLKTICEGLSRNGETRLPRGFHGITSAFDLYLDAVNKQLADLLDYNPKDNLVRRAAGSIAAQFVESELRWLPRAQAEEMVNEFLPGMSFSKSLYHGLVTAGVLVEEMNWGSNVAGEEVVFIAYERFMDHIVADSLLKTYPNDSRPRGMFGRLRLLLKDCVGGFLNILAQNRAEPLTQRGGLTFLNEAERYVSPGLIEALCIQVPEQTGQELVRLAPQLLNTWGIGEAFQESIIWRKLDAFSDDTGEVWNELIASKKIWGNPIDTLLTVSTIPDHPFNAEHLDRRLRRDSIPDRDAWWSTHLHEAYETNGPVDRLVDWASNVSPDDSPEDTVVDLSAVTLAWILTTPNRFLRDKATKALVLLLTGRLESAARMVERFADVDDPYVAERVYAVTYGVAMRSHDTANVEQLASSVYEKVFASGSPPAHILLRDYARGVVERAVYLGADIFINEDLIHPPYQSAWPYIPDEEAVEALIPSRGQGSGDFNDAELSAMHIRGSVMHGDFATYVIGIRGSSAWLSLSLDQDPWQSPEERIQEWIPKLSESEFLAWEEYEGTQTLPLLDFQPLILGEGQNVFSQLFMSDDDLTSSSEEDAGPDPEDPTVDAARDRLMAQLTVDRHAELDAIFQDMDDRERREAPRFDLQLVQRYILWRVFDLGWTVERFGNFDRFVSRSWGREAAKPERIGKKYQWIAYYEILAYLSDHYQYRKRYRADGSDQRYQGPWQENFRDIDPSSPPGSAIEGASGSSRSLSWQRRPAYEAWSEDLCHGDWFARTEDIPQVEKCLIVDNPDEGTRWLNVSGFFLWQQSYPANVGPFDIERRELWLRCTGYFVHPDDANDFTDWFDSTDAERRELIGAPEMHGLFFGEYGWSPAFKHYVNLTESEAEVTRESEWSRFIRPAAVSYDTGISSFDCSEKEISSASLPSHEFIAHLGLRWSGRGSEYLDGSGELAAFATTRQGETPTALLLREDLVKRYLADQDLALCWTVMGEKMAIGGESTDAYRGCLTMTGVYRYTDERSVGSLRFDVDGPVHTVDDAAREDG